MKKCHYCEKEYSDDATVCAIDGEPLLGLGIDRKKVSGIWHGVYGYAENGKQAGRGPVAFTLKLKQGWLAHFTGSVTEDRSLGVPGAGVVDGYFKSPTIEFTKQMPVDYVAAPDGSRMTLREHIISLGHECKHDLPSAPIFYQGTFLDSNRVQGTWAISARRIPLPGGSSLSTEQNSGFWCAEFMAADAGIDPPGGPTAPLFDKALLSSRELENVEGVPSRSLGKFTVVDAENFQDRFWRENIRFNIKQDDDVMRQISAVEATVGAGTAQMVEIFVHPDDWETAMEIIAESRKV